MVRNLWVIVHVPVAGTGRTTPMRSEAALALFSLPMGRGRGAKSSGGAKKLSKKREKDYSPPLKLRILRCKIKKIFCEAHFQVIFGQNRTKTAHLAPRRTEKLTFFCSKPKKRIKKSRKWEGAKSKKNGQGANFGLGPPLFRMLFLPSIHPA